MAKNAKFRLLQDVYWKDPVFGVFHGIVTKIESKVFNGFKAPRFQHAYWIYYKFNKRSCYIYRFEDSVFGSRDEAKKG